MALGHIAGVVQVHTSTVLMRRDTQNKVGLFDTELARSGEDYDFHFRTCRVGKVAYVDVSSINYCIGAPDQLTAYENWIWMAKNDLRTLEAVLDDKEYKVKLPKEMINMRMGSVHEAIGVLDIFNDKYNANSHLKQSIKWYKFKPRVYGYLLMSYLPMSVIGGMLKFKRFITNNNKTE